MLPKQSKSQTAGKAQQKEQDLRYGENPQQSACLRCLELPHNFWQPAQQLQGKPLSANIRADTDAAWLVVEFDDPSVIILAIRILVICYGGKMLR